ncbi:nuclear exosome regulator NRDE2 [Drosophila albomicans]|uniref:Nuclear exosome regulator NRDE2 n=1 Tax=Drosophila albomicans TaxID=7291 RepID=A0A6P8XXV3_DROAB|nr:nuclear exosome regulator NRDE2 [Drosophila albomicans]
MPLFPAYASNEPNEPPNASEAHQSQQLPVPTNAATEEVLQNNRSFELPALVLVPPQPSDSDFTSSSEESADDDQDNLADNQSSGAVGNAIAAGGEQRILEFDKDTGFYVDKKPNNAYLRLPTLPRLSRPNYKRSKLRLGGGPRQTKQRAKQRPRLRLVEEAAIKTSEEQLTQLLERIQELKKLLAFEPQDERNWLELHQLLGDSATKSNRLAVAEQQLHALETAMEQHPGNEKLLQCYVATASVTYPDSQVASKLEELLQRQPQEYTLWTALIMTTQGTMARCNVPDVLAIYSKCMERLFRERDHDERADELMLKLFHNCVLFLRQSANTPQMFALLNLALELNAPHLQFDCLAASAQDERPLVDYEELVLRSGMPMPEIWTRIERLRQAYNFLPYPQQANVGIAVDPRRCIYTEDVCAYIYPLKTQTYRMQLLLLVVQLTKLPLLRTHCLAERLCTRIDQIGDSEAIEMLLAGLADRWTYALPPKSGDYMETMMQLARELYVCPSFMPQAIGHELYERCIAKLLLQCSEVCAANEAQRQVFIILWLRLQRLRLQLRKLCGKLTPQFLKETSDSQRSLLRQPANRQVICFYTQVAMFEYEALGEDKAEDSRPSSAFRVLDQVLAMAKQTPLDADQLQAAVVYAEMLMANDSRDAALKLLVPLASRELLDAELEKVAELAGKTPADPLPLEQYFLPNMLTLLLRAVCLQLYLQHNSSKVEALAMLEATLQHRLFQLPQMEATRVRFLREQICELQLLMLQLPRRCALSELLPHLQHGLLEFPRNQTLLQLCSTLDTTQWIDVRCRLKQTKAGILALLHMIIAARCRFLRHQKSHDLAATFGYQTAALDAKLQEDYLRNRLLSIFESFLPTNTRRTKLEAEQYAVLRRNSLYWRCYLRCLSNERTSFEQSKTCLLMALDECPWDKALYMDGVTYVPQEFSNLQDVMAEKQICTFAIPEELNVLREA